MNIPAPMDRLAGELDTAAEALRGAMHAITDLHAGDTIPNDWYQRCGQLHQLTLRTSELCDAVADHISYLWPNPRLYATAGNDTFNHIQLAVTVLRDAARTIGQANGHINQAWTQVGQVGVHDDEGGPS